MKLRIYIVFTILQILFMTSCNENPDDIKTIDFKAGLYGDHGQFGDSLAVNHKRWVPDELLALYGDNASGVVYGNMFNETQWGSVFFVVFLVLADPMPGRVEDRADFSGFIIDQLESRCDLEGLTPFAWVYFSKPDSSDEIEGYMCYPGRDDFGSWCAFVSKDGRERVDLQMSALQLINNAQYAYDEE